jgi:predicted ABC-type ATPase
MSSETKNKKLRIVAGPNGSGKSTIIRELQKQYNLGIFLNADEIQFKINQNGFLDYSYYLDRTINNVDWILFLDQNDRTSSQNLRLLHFNEYHITTKNKLDGYDAAIIADFLRSFLLEEDKTFTFETVFSHPSKLDLIRSAKKQGFKIYYYFICTVDPMINVKRVKSRVLQGGHNVDFEKIRSRYYRSLQLMYDAFMLSDRAFIMDTTYEESDIIVEKNASEITLHTDIIPTWVNEYLLKHLEE